MEPLPPPRNRPSRLSPSQSQSQSQSSSRARDTFRNTESFPPAVSTFDHDTNSNKMNPPPPITGSETRPQGPQATDTSTTVKAKKRRHRGGKKRKNRRQSFAAPSEADTATSAAEITHIDPLLEGDVTSPPRFYRQRTNRSDESLDSDHLLDHREQPMMRPRRESRATPSNFNASHRGPSYFPGGLGRRDSGEQTRRRPQSRNHHSSEDESFNGPEPSDRTPLIGDTSTRRSPKQSTFGLFKSKSRGSSKSSGRKKQTQAQSQSYQSFDQDYDVNNPPSVPGSPDMRPQYSQRNTPDTGFLARSPDSRRNLAKDALIDIDQDDDRDEDQRHSVPGSPEFRPNTMTRHQTISLPVEGDVCFPAETMSEMGGYEDFERTHSAVNGHKRRSRRRQWPQLWALDEWSHQEKEQRAGKTGVKKISEPVLIEGRLRPQKHPWHRLDEDAPYRYTYFNDDFESTIHAQSISELVQSGGSFRELFIPDPPLLSDSSESEEEEEESEDRNLLSPRSQINMARETSNVAGRIDSILNEKSKSDSRAPSVRGSAANSGDHTPQNATKGRKPKKYGPRPTFWLDIQSPTDQEMRVLCKTFGIHALTSEDIMMQEAREKVELFRHYYFINYRTFEQDTNSEDYLEPINMYVVVFRQGILTFHFSQIPHPANVRRRIRQLTDYLILSSDWISYAIIDDITDVYQPLIHNIEAEVDDIDELILRAFHETDELKGLVDGEKKASNDSDTDEDTKPVSGIDMLRRIGECRKKVMSLYRLLGNKADVIKGFAKRCNEQWEVAPKTEIGLYLGDIQDHILTMTSNLSHYETLLSRAHSNYLAQVSIRMNERQEQTSDVLGKLTVVGTIVLPMNIICGMWGMNVKVPGQDIDNLNWFAAITAGLILFALVCYFFCKRVYGIV